MAIHVNYLVNLASTTPLFLKKSIEAFRGEVERALALCADYLVLHPGSFRGADREAGLIQTSAAIAAATQGLDLVKGKLTILIENTAGAEYSLGGSFEQVAEVLERLRNVVPIAACIDTCHTHVAGYDIVSEERNAPDAIASRRDCGAAERIALALQRCQGCSRIEVGPASTHREGNDWLRTVSAAAE